MTYQEQFDSAMKCTSAKEASAWLATEIRRYRREGGLTVGEDPKAVILANLGYMAGYCDVATRQKVYDLFGAEHPIFGKPREVSAEEAFQAGKSFAATLSLLLLAYSLLFRWVG